MQLLVHKGRQTSVGRRSLATGNLIARTRLCAEEDSNPTGESPVGRVPRDPIGEEGGINLYGYAGNNSVPPSGRPRAAFGLNLDG